MGDFIASRFAVGHFNRGGDPPTLQRPFVPATSVTAGGVGLCITDLIAYARFHLGAGQAASGEPVLRRETLELMRTTQLRKQGMDDDMGIAWQYGRAFFIIPRVVGLAAHAVEETVRERPFRAINMKDVACDGTPERDLPERYRGN